MQDKVSERRNPQPADPRRQIRSIWLGWSTALVILVVVLAMYLISGLYGVRPAGHPWVPMAWIVVAYLTLRRVARNEPVPALAYWITLAIAVIGAGVWAAATWNIIQQANN